MKHLTHNYQYILITVLLLTLKLLSIPVLHAQQFNRYLNSQIVPSQRAFNSYKKTIEKQYSTAIEENNSTQKIQTLVLLSSIERATLNYGAAFEKSGEALFLAEESGNVLLLAKAHEEFGIINFLFKRDEIAGAHFKQAHTYYQTAYASNLISASTLYRSYYNQLLYYQRTENEEMTQVYIDSCRTLATSEKLNEHYKIYLNEKQAFLLIRENKLNEALTLLQCSAQTLENLRQNSETGYIHSSFLIIIYSVMGKIYRLQNNAELAQRFYEKSIRVDDLYGEHTFYSAYVYSTYASLLADLGKHAASYKKLLQSKRINDKYLNARSESTHGFLSVRDRYTEELRKKSEELNRKDLQLSENKQEILRFRIIFFIIIFLIIVFALVVRTRIQKIKHEKEKDRNLKKQQEAQALLSHKNKELSTTMLQLIEKEEIIKTLTQHLGEKLNDNKTLSLLNTIEKRSASLWEAFNSRFIEVNDDFYERLKAKVPDLSASDLKICALIKLNFSGKEMAYLLGISPGSVNVARHRLRKKMQIDRNTNLSKFINSI